MRVMPPKAALMVAERVEVTCKAVTGKVAVVAPPGTVTLGGTWAVAGLLLVRVTTAPPAAAAPPRVTVAVAMPPPGTTLEES